MATIIKLWKNKFTECPSVQLGHVCIDFGKKETKAQRKLIEMIANHPDAVLQNELIVPLDPPLIEAFLELISEEVAHITHKVDVTVN